MATLILIKKGIYFMLLMGILPVFAQIINSTIGFFPVVVASIFMLIIVSPEIGLIFRGFRKIVIQGLRNEIGNFDTIDAALLYVAVLPVRATAFGYLYMMIGAWDPTPTQLYGPLGGTVGIAILKYLTDKKK